MAQMGDNLVDQVAQLNAARNLVLGDAALYPQIVHGILPIIGAHSRLELRRWGSDFLAETFASPVLATAQKDVLAEKVLQTLREILELPEGDAAVLKSVVQASASLYPLVFRHVINHPAATAIWESMTAIKQNILQRWDNFPTAVKICCVKFVQRIIQVQTPGLISDPRRPEQNETSLAIVPRGHALLTIPNLEAESSGLLDRLLSVFQENSSDPLFVNATLNCLSVLIRTRQSISNKIISAILSFNPHKQVNGPMTPSLRVGLKSMERTTRSLLVNIMKRSPNHPLAGKMQQHIERMAQSRVEALDEISRKRTLPGETIDSLESAKRARMDAPTPPTVKIPPLPQGPISYSQLFTLTEDAGLSSFDVKQLPMDLIVRITVPVLARIDPSVFSQALEGIRNRYQTLSQQQAASRQPAAVEEEEDDYEPEYQPMDVSDLGPDQPDATKPEVDEFQPDIVSLGPFVLPQPPPLTEDEAGELGRSAATRVFSMLGAPDLSSQPGKAQQRPLGFSRLAGSTFDRDAWATLLTRLATRAPAGLEVDTGDTKTDRGLQKKPTVSDTVRETLYRYILEDFRSRLNLGISWLNEEWYNDRIQLRFAATQRGEEDSDEPSVPLHYDRWVVRLLDGILPYLDSRDLKVLVRFLSEIPEMTIPVAQRVASLAKDPERVNLCVQALLYLIMFRPPAREMCLNTLEDVYNTYEESRPVAGKILVKWRPAAVETQQSETPAETSQQ
ncbi:hypothetical protein ASPZODRAFT_2090875 [Penicilliopsis zonata CBS 506.65]|uniref:Symplekin/Pta1 N-terminal domain-containing protein n=1 Tax=Penicilliopsis zonata CBS 506.65 TaxID=1073090 RepID=A0A1L9SGA7_9EURO|nr:hypothetical protein ASPZODRAFT_2090875 [Penicilliopsis zonata CBS 506.65]OJJ46270.1 hypothetical protein ASPZODRAFT_2090875 [Penicilliopsis zonata CBS 506.65]